MSAEDSAGPIGIEPARVADWMAEDAGLQLIDVREPYEREAGHIADSRHIELLELAARADTLERGRPVVVYCRAGIRSDMAAQALRAAGFEAYSMLGGLLRWAREGRALSPEGATVADH